MFPNTQEALSVSALSIVSPDMHLNLGDEQLVHIEVGVTFRWEEDTKILWLVGGGVQWELAKVDGDYWLTEHGRV